MNTNRGMWWRIPLVLIGALVVTALGIDAADTLRGSDGTLLSQVIRSTTPPTCPGDMQKVDTIATLTCIDRYEASPKKECVHTLPASILESEQNVNDADCAAASIEGAMPWTYVSLAQAQRACAQAGKRLPTPDEWYRMALGTDAATCVVNAPSVAPAGTLACLSAVGAYDVIGNVWEWVDAQVTDNSYEGRTLPQSGHVAAVDADGIALTTSPEPDFLYGDDYFWSKTEGVFGMIRGGFYGSGSDAGLYALNASIPTNFTAQGVGFRCVK
jgi:formylglycine-generating enzyme required for sulfatase activity